MMQYFHVILSFKDAPNNERCVYENLSENDLKKLFLKPYQQGTNLLSDKEVLNIFEIKKVTIIKTDGKSEIELKEIQEKSWKEVEEFNRTSNSVVRISAGRGYDSADIVEAGQDVTAQYIFGPPGQGSTINIVAGIINHPWISAIGTGLIVAAIVGWLGWN